MAENQPLIRAFKSSKECNSCGSSPGPSPGPSPSPEPSPTPTTYDPVMPTDPPTDPTTTPSVMPSYKPVPTTDPTTTSDPVIPTEPPSVMPTDPPSDEPVPPPAGDLRICEISQDAGHQDYVKQMKNGCKALLGVFDPNNGADNFCGMCKFSCSALKKKGQCTRFPVNCQWANNNCNDLSDMSSGGSICDVNMETCKQPDESLLDASKKLKALHTYEANKKKGCTQLLGQLSGEEGDQFCNRCHMRCEDQTESWKCLRFSNFCRWTGPKRRNSGGYCEPL